MKIAYLIGRNHRSKSSEFNTFQDRKSRLSRAFFIRKRSKGYRSELGMPYNTLEIMSTVPLRYESIAWSTAVYIYIIIKI